MRVTGSRLFVLVTLACVVLAAPALSAESQVVAEPAVAAVAVAPAPAAAQATATGAMCAATNPSPSAASAAPDWLAKPAGNCCIPECRRDRDCNGVCGALGGQCAQVNSCCTACLCYG